MSSSSTFNQHHHPMFMSSNDHKNNGATALWSTNPSAAATNTTSTATTTMSPSSSTPSSYSPLVVVAIAWMYERLLGGVLGWRIPILLAWILPCGLALFVLLVQAASNGNAVTVLTTTTVTTTILLRYYIKTNSQQSTTTTTSLPLMALRRIFLRPVRLFCTVLIVSCFVARRRYAQSFLGNVINRILPTAVVSSWQQVISRSTPSSSPLQWYCYNYWQCAKHQLLIFVLLILVHVTILLRYIGPCSTQRCSAMPLRQNPIRVLWQGAPHNRNSNSHNNKSSRSIINSPIAAAAALGDWIGWLLHRLLFVVPSDVPGELWTTTTTTATKQQRQQAITSKNDHVIMTAQRWQHPTVWIQCQRGFITVLVACSMTLVVLGSFPPQAWWWSSSSSAAAAAIASSSSSFHDDTATRVVDTTITSAWWIAAVQPLVSWVMMVSSPLSATLVLTLIGSLWIAPRLLHVGGGYNKMQHEVDPNTYFVRLDSSDPGDDHDNDDLHSMIVDDVRFVRWWWWWDRRVLRAIHYAVVQPLRQCGTHLLLLACLAPAIAWMILVLTMIIWMWTVQQQSITLNAAASAMLMPYNRDVDLHKISAYYQLMYLYGLVVFISAGVMGYAVVLDQLVRVTLFCLDDPPLTQDRLERLVQDLFVMETSDSDTRLASPTGGGPLSSSSLFAAEIVLHSLLYNQAALVEQVLMDPTNEDENTDPSLSDMTTKRKNTTYRLEDLERWEYRRHQSCVLAMTRTLLQGQATVGTSASFASATIAAPWEEGMFRVALLHMLTLSSSSSFLTATLLSGSGTSLGRSTALPLQLDDWRSHTSPMAMPLVRALCLYVGGLGEALSLIAESRTTMMMIHRKVLLKKAATIAWGSSLYTSSALLPQEQQQQQYQFERDSLGAWLEDEVAAGMTWACPPGLVFCAAKCIEAIIHYLSTADKNTTSWIGSAAGGSSSTLTALRLATLVPVALQSLFCLRRGVLQWNQQQQPPFVDGNGAHHADSSMVAWPPPSSASTNMDDISVVLPPQEGGEKSTKDGAFFHLVRMCDNAARAMIVRLPTATTIAEGRGGPSIIMGHHPPSANDNDRRRLRASMATTTTTTTTATKTAVVDPDCRAWLQSLV